MSKVGIVIGLLLIAVGVAGYMTPSEVVTEGSPEGEVVETKRSPTALIPVGFGLPILLCGIWGTMAPASNKTAMHIAVTFGLLGGLAATVRGFMSLIKLINADGEFNQRAVVFLVLMGTLCWMFVVAGVMSFIKARKAREATEAAAE